MESYEADYYELRLGGAVLIVSPFKNENELSMISRPARPSLLSADVWLEAGSLVPLTLEYAKKLGPIKLRLLWESDSIEREVIPTESLLHTLGSQTTPFPLLVIPAATDASKSSLSNDLDYRFAVVDVEETLTLYARDAFSNLQIH